MTDKPRYAYDNEEGFVVDMHNPQPGGLGTELLMNEVVDLMNERDAMLAVVRALHTGNYSQDDPKLRKALATLPEHLKSPHNDK